MFKRIKWALALAVLPAVAGYFGCNLNDPNIPDLAGPSELAQALEMRAVPDQLTGDGRSSSVITAVLRDPNGQPTGSQTINFDLGVQGQVGALGGIFQDIGNLAPVDGPQPGVGGVDASAVSAVTNGSGVARARYWAPFRTNQTNDITVTITGRPAGNDFRAVRQRQVDIFIRAADRPFFPGDDVCGIMKEPNELIYAVGQTIFFSATQLTGDTNKGAAGHPIARYEWDLGDGATAEGRRVGHAFERSSIFTVTLFTTESITGFQDSCFVLVEVTLTGTEPPVPPPTACGSPSATFAISNTCSTGGDIITGVTTFFNASGSTAGSTVGATIVSYTWDFGDGTPPFATGSPSTSHVYLPPAGRTLEISLQVLNSCGETAGVFRSKDTVASCP